jgi:hypothetical protein
MTIYMDNASVQVGTGPDGSKMLEIVDPQSGIKVAVILPEQSARKIASALTGVFLATMMPGNGKGVNRE